MSTRNFIIVLRDDGGARLSLSYKGAEQHGISRISCDIPAADLVQLVLFDGSISVQTALGAVRRTELTLGGLVLKYGAVNPDLLSFDRQSGFSSKTAFCSMQEFHSEMADITDVCLARAETAKHGAVLQDMLARCPVPEALSGSMEPDAADQVFHRLREMTLMILAQQVAARGSGLARNLRGKKTRQDAVHDVHAVLVSLVHEFADQGRIWREETSC